MDGNKENEEKERGQWPNGDMELSDIGHQILNIIGNIDGDDEGIDTIDTAYIITTNLTSQECPPTKKSKLDATSFVTLLYADFDNTWFVNSFRVFE